MSTASTTTYGEIAPIYDFWFGLIPQFLTPLGAGTPGSNSGARAGSGIGYPADQIARAATMTQEAMRNLAQVCAPMLQAAGANGLLGQWAAAMPMFAGVAPKGDIPAAPQNLFAQWAAMIPQFPGWPSGEGAPVAPGFSGMLGPCAAAYPFFPSSSPTVAGMPAAGIMAPWLAAFQSNPALAGANPSQIDASPATLPFQAMLQAWPDFPPHFAGASQQAIGIGFDRTFGALSDALGLGPMRKLKAAYEELIQSMFAQNDARAKYALLVQGAFGAGFDALLRRLVQMAKAGEKIDSMMVFLRLWAACTEEAVHQVLQSAAGLAATAALSRAGVANRRKLQRVAGIVADSLDLSTRAELDEAFREIQELKRQLRGLKQTVAASATPAAPPRTKKRAKK